MKRSFERAAWRVAAGLALGAALWLPIAAQEPKRVEQKRVSLRLEKAEAVKVLGQLVRTMDARLEFQCGTPAPVTIAFENLTPQTAVSAICETAGLQWQLVESPERIVRVTCAPAPPVPVAGEGGAQVRVERRVEKSESATSEHITLDLNEAKVDEVMKLSADLMDAKLVLDPALSGKMVTYKVVNAPLSEALDGLCELIGARWSFKPGDTPTLKVTAK